MLESKISSLFVPQGETIGLLSIPHSGELFPEEFQELLTPDLRALAEDVDFKVDELVDIDLLVKNGVTVLVSHVHRTCIDLNRSEDLAIIAWKNNSKGLKLQVKEYEESFRQSMLNKYYHPYYYLLKSIIEKLSAKYPRPVVIDLHSMPSRPTEYHLKVTPNQPKVRPHFCVSDIKGESCSQEFIDSMSRHLKEFDQDVSQNIPYFGGHITRDIDKKFPHTQNIQIEISREIYMDEQEKVLVAEQAEKLKPKLTEALIRQFKEFTR